jgi:hypothetical protein
MGTSASTLHDRYRNVAWHAPTEHHLHQARPKRPSSPAICRAVRLLCTYTYCAPTPTVHLRLLCTYAYCAPTPTVHLRLLCTYAYCAPTPTVHLHLLCTYAYCAPTPTVHLRLLCTCCGCGCRLHGLAQPLVALPVRHLAGPAAVPGGGIRVQQQQQCSAVQTACSQSSSLATRRIHLAASNVSIHPCLHLSRSDTTACVGC